MSSSTESTEPKRPLEREAAPGRRSTYLRSGVAALGVLVVIGILINLLLLTHRSPGVLDGQVVAERIAQGIQFDQHTTLPPTVRCPLREALRAGNEFTCTLQRRPYPVVIDVRVRDSVGDFTYRVTSQRAG